MRVEITARSVKEAFTENAGELWYTKNDNGDLGERIVDDKKYVKDSYNIFIT